MKPPLKPGPSLFARVIGVGVILLAASTWPDVFWPGVFAGLGVLFGPDFIPGK